MRLSLALLCLTVGFAAALYGLRAMLEEGLL